MAGGCLSFGSEDAALQALGNALMLNLMVQHQRNGLINRAAERRRTRSLEEQQAESDAYRERIALREALQFAGAYDIRLEGPESLTWPGHMESLADAEKRIENLANSGADIATLRLRDFPFPRWMLNLSGVRYSLVTADPYELRAPLATGHISGELVKALLEAVIDYFRGRISDAAPILSPGLFADPDETEPAEAEADAKSGGPRTGAKIADEKRAEAALRTMAAENPGKRMAKRDFCDALLDFIPPPEGFSENAAFRVWRIAAPQEWQAGGRIGGDIDRLTANDLEPYLRAELGKRPDSRSGIDEPPEPWDALLKL